MRPSARIEADIAPLEEIRFMNERVYNYSAVVEAMILSGFDDIAAGTGGPFNPRVPTEIQEQLRQRDPRFEAVPLGACSIFRVLLVCRTYYQRCYHVLRFLSTPPCYP